MNDTRLKVGASENAEATKRFSALNPEVPPRKHWGYQMRGRTYHIGAHGATEPAKGDLSLEALGG